VKNDAAGVLIDGVNKLLLPVDRRGSEPNSAMTDDWSRQAEAFQVDFPSDVLAGGIVPLSGHALGIAFRRAAILKRTVPTGPGEIV
jgi:hypothetical protein